MDIFSLLMSAKIVDTDGGEYNDVVGFQYAQGRLMIVLQVETEDEDDDDDPEKEDIPEPSINEKIRAISGGKKGS